MKKIKRLSAFALVLSLLVSCAVFPANAVIKREITIAEGTQEQLPIYPRYYDEYTLGDSSIAQFDFDEVYGLKPGTTTLSFLGMDGEEYEYTVKVTPAPSSIKLNCKTKTIYTGKSFKLKYTLSAGSTGQVWFSSSNNDVAYVDYDGKVVAQSKGKATITAETYNGKKATCKVTVKQSLTAIRLSRQRIAIPKKTKYKLKAVVDDGAKSKSYKWKSSNKKVVSVKGKGKSATITAKKPGKAKITVKAANGVKQTCTVRVTKTKTTDSLKKQLNSQPLYKEKTGYEVLDKLVQKIFKKIFRKGYSTYDKVKAIYDYEVKTFSYGSKELSAKQYKKAAKSKRIYYPVSYDDQLANWAYRTLVTKKGVCSDYAAVFTVMTRALGLDCYSVSGITTKAGGGWTGHTWNNMLINGRYVTFDAQVEDDIAGGGAVYYYRFLKPDSEMKRYYKPDNREGDIRSYNHFKPDYEFKTYFNSFYW